MAEKEEKLEAEEKDTKKETAEAVKSEKAVKFDAMLKELDIQAFQKQEVGDEYGTVLYRSSMEIKGQFLPVIVIFDASIYGIVRVIVGSKVVNEKNESDLAAYINEMNSRYKVFKYYKMEPIKMTDVYYNPESVSGQLNALNDKMGPKTPYTYKGEKCTNLDNLESAYDNKRTKE